MRIALAQTRFPNSVAEGLDIVLTAIKDAAGKKCDIICFPESIVPGLRGVGYSVEEYDHERMTDVLDKVSGHARDTGVAVVLPMEWKDDLGLHIVAFMISECGEIFI